MPAEMERLGKHRSQVRTQSGPAGYIDTGGPGRPALFVPLARFVAGFCKTLGLTGIDLVANDTGAGRNAARFPPVIARTGR